jgi:hypothetical protein
LRFSPLVTRNGEAIQVAMGLVQVPRRPPQRWSRARAVLAVLGAMLLLGAAL